jgi:hypothetical protein
LITDLDEALKQLLIKKSTMDPAEIEITFDTPNRDWSASISKPTINFYLYDIRENHTLRGHEWFIEKNRNNAVSKKNANRIDLSYLVTVWTNNTEDQHRLLWRVLSTLFSYPTIPSDLLTGDLARQDYPVVTSVAQPDGLFNNPSDFWAALDNEIKPSINYVVTIPLDLDIAFTSPVVKTTAFSVKPPDTEAEQFLLIKGLVHVAGKTSQPIPKAIVLSKETNMTAVTDKDGEYTFARMSQGKYTFQVLIEGKIQKEIKMKIPDRNYDIEV